MTKKQVQFRFNISLSVIDRIKRIYCKKKQVRVSDITKLSEENKEKLKKAIIKYA